MMVLLKSNDKLVALWIVEMRYQAPPDKKRRETLLSAELGKYLDKRIRVKFQGGRENPKDQFKLTDETRSLGLVVCRGTAVVLICPADTMEPIANPFLQQEPS
uniref:LSM domain-containing protein n=1 Tax=Amphimedon queenslandica TaxID=400682 RepID=A0A1X7VTE5_AMPQE